MDRAQPAQRRVCPEAVQYADDLYKEKIGMSLNELFSDAVLRIYNAVRFGSEQRDEKKRAALKKKSKREAIAEQLYERGCICPDKEVAVEFFLESAEKGYAPAQYKLGECYYWGKGVPKDEDEGAQWYWKAALQGHAEAQYSLARCYDLGFGGPKDHTQAEKWYQKAAEQGHIDAQYALAELYLYSCQVKDYTLAEKWYRKLAEQGHVRAQVELAEHYSKWCYLPRNYEEAVKWGQKAAEQGSIRAMEILAYCYTTGGYGLARDDAKAVQWRSKCEKAKAREKVEDAI